MNTTDIREGLKVRIQEPARFANETGTVISNVAYFGTSSVWDVKLSKGHIEPYLNSQLEPEIKKEPVHYTNNVISLGTRK
jgi:hypothetical protein